MIPPTDASDGKLDEKTDVSQIEVMVTTDVTINLASDTEDSKTIVSKLDQTVSVESKNDEDLSKTTESPDVCLTMSRTQRT